MYFNNFRFNCVKKENSTNAGGEGKETERRRTNRKNAGRKAIEKYPNVVTFLFKLKNLLPIVMVS